MFLIFQQLLMVFESLLRVFVWFHLQKVALQIHCFSIDLGVAPKVFKGFLSNKFGITMNLLMMYLLKVSH